MTHRILVATDLGTEAAHALARAVFLARNQPDAEVHALRVCLPGDSESRAAADLAEHLAQRLPPAATRPIVHVMTSHSIVDGIIHAAAELGADVVAVGSRGGRLLAGGTAEGLLERLPTNLMVVRHHHGGHANDGQALVGVDFSEESRRALELASSLRGNHELGLVHVVEAEAHARPRLPRPEPETATLALRERLAAWGGRVATHAFVEHGEVGATLAAVAEREHASFIAVGARGLRDGKGAIGSSAATRLIRAATMPVLIAR